MKKTKLLGCLLLIAALLTACGSQALYVEPDSGKDSAKKTELTLWAFPVGNWGNPAAVSNLLTNFHKEYPGIHVSVKHLTYDNGDDTIQQAAKDGTLPDLVLEGPERLVASWGEQGWMAGLSDLWETDCAKDIYENVRVACRHRNGDYYVFPICMSAHCMAINYEMFRNAGALEYIDEATHTWTTEGFIQAVRALTAYGQKSGILYCKNQSGDQGTRALVTNLCGGTFTDAAHTTYTVDSEENREALQLLYDLEGITFEPSLAANDAIRLFCQKETAMCFCWNGSMQVQQTINSADLDFEVFPMAFPTSEAAPELQGGIWGFGVFDNGNAERIEAAKPFIRYITENEASYTRAVWASSYWPVRDVGNIYENDMLMTEYSIFTPYLGDYYQITPRWAEARTAWWQMLGKIGEGADIAEATAGFLADTSG